MAGRKVKSSTRRQWIAAAAVALAVAVVLLRQGPLPTTQKLTLGGRVFTLELALDNQSRYRGLSHREQIDPDGGMLFVFDTARRQAFVMRDCLIPIDLIYLGPSGRIVHMHQMEVEPPETRKNPRRLYHSNGPAQFAIELAGGTLPQLALKEGQKINLPYEKLKTRLRRVDEIQWDSQ